MRLAFGTGKNLGMRLAVCLLALLLLGPQALAAPQQPTVELTHTGSDGRVVLACTAKVAEPDSEGTSRVSMTLTIQAPAGLTIDPSSVQAIYQTEDGETMTLDQSHWTADKTEGLVVTALEVDTDMGGQIQCRVSGQTSAQSALTATAKMDVTYLDLETGQETGLSGSGKDTIQPPAPAKKTGYTLTLDLNGGSLTGKGSTFLWQEDLSAGQQVDLSSLPQPARSGYFFDGWTVAAGTGAKISGNTLTVGSGDVTLRAAWSSKADKLTLDLNGGSGRLVTIDGITGEDVTLPAPSEVLYSRAGYKLAGWCATPDGQGKTYTGGESYTLSREEDILYAWWAPQYTLSYDGNGGTGQMPRRVFSANEQAVIAENAFKRTGYDFTGWCLSADGRGTKYQSGDKLTLTGDATLYAQWEKTYDTVPANQSDGGSRLPLILGILAAVVVIGGICGYLAWKRRQDDGDPFDDEYDDGYDDGYDDYDDGYDDPRNRRPRDRYDRYDSPRDRYDRYDDDRQDRYRDARDRHDDRRDRYNDRRRGRYDDYDR